MCGIFAVITRSRQPITTKKLAFREIAYNQSARQRHRGPDFTGAEILPNHGVAMVHERLCIVGVHSGHQPLKSRDENVVLVANGEIYNYLELSKEIAEKLGEYTPKSDCNVIIELYEMYGVDLIEHITGMFAFVLYDKKKQFIMMARDPYGIIPMYIGRDSDNNVWVASEMKCLVLVCTEIKYFEPGTMMYGTINDLKEEKYFNPLWLERPINKEVDLSVLRYLLENAVRSHLQCDVQLGVLLSGGVDSSLIASIASRIMKQTNPDYKIKSYSVGLKGAPDFKYSNMVAKHIGSDHTEVHFTLDQGLDCIEDIIYKLETYDVTTVRCSIPMYLLTRYIKSEGVKMILSGEGADEIFGGYLYFFQAPNAKEFHHELVTRVTNLHLSDCLRANKSALAWGVELRVPFLDTAFVDYVMSLNPAVKIPGEKNTFIEDAKASKKIKSTTIEKYILRNAFSEDDYLPKEVLWRQKEQFSDGVGYSWIDTIKNYAASKVSDAEFLEASKRFPDNTPTTKEAFHYRELFEKMFPGRSCAQTVKKWTPRTDWGCPEDPSGRAQACHKHKE